MKRTLVAVGVLTLMGIGISSGAFGQKGMGDAEGIAPRQTNRKSSSFQARFAK